MYFHLHRSQNDSLKILNCFYGHDDIAAVQVRLTQNQQNTGATNLCWRIASAEPTDYLCHIQVFLCFGPFLQLIRTKIFPHF